MRDIRARDDGGHTGSPEQHGNFGRVIGKCFFCLYLCGRGEDIVDKDKHISCRVERQIVDGCDKGTKDHDDDCGEHFCCGALPEDVVLCDKGEKDGKASQCCEHGDIDCARGRDSEKCIGDIEYSRQQDIFVGPLNVGAS